MAPAQQGMFVDSQVKDPADYNVVLQLRIDPIEPERIDSGIRLLMTRQPALRSAVAAGVDGVSYVLADSVEPSLVHHDLRGRPDALAVRDELSEIAEATAGAAFDLSAPPLFRVAHCRLDAEDRLIVVCHHLIADGLSVSILAEQLMELAVGGEPIDRDVPRDTGFEIYQRHQASALPDRKAALRSDFWQHSLSRHEAPNLSHWITPATGELTGREVRMSVDEGLARALRRSAQEAEVSEFTVYLGVFGVLLGQYAHADQVSVATPFTDRSSPEAEQSIGCFLKTLPILVDAAPAHTVRAVLERLSHEILQTWKHLNFPITDLLSQRPATKPIFDITFIQDRYPGHPAGVRGAATSDRVRFPGLLTVLVEQIGDNCELVFQFKEPALSLDQIRRFGRRYLRLLEQVPANLDAPAGCLRIDSDAETTALLTQLSDTHHRDWEPVHLGAAFLRKTEADPSAIAWSDATRSYTNAWAHDAAVLVQRRLRRALGDTSGPVAILLPRGVQLLVGVFATLLAGRPYVPLVPTTPAARRTAILTDAGVSAVLTISDLDLALPDGMVRLDLDTWEELTSLDTDERTRSSEQPDAVELHSDDVLYIEYTSGSTGVPKGVIIRHDSLYNTAIDLERLYPLGPEDVYLLKTSFSFDIFGTEVYGWLVGAGRLAILPTGLEGDPGALLGAIRDAGVTHVNFAPTMLRLLLEMVATQDRTDDLTSLRYLFCGGEALTTDVVDRFFALSLTCSLENVYGPTEATMWATHTTVRKADAAMAITPIGTALNDYRVYVLGRDDQLCGVEVPGELCIAGPGVAAGYLNRPELNAAHFVDNPWYDPATDESHQRRMYRTGDLGYLRADGRLAFLRRNDRQVKVGGVRVELGEVEHALLRVDGIVEAAAVVDESAEPARLVGFFTARRHLDAGAVRAELARTLEPQQLPAELIQLGQLPTSAAGKLDRRVLLGQVSERPVVEPPAAPASPASPVAERLSRLWRAALGSSTIDPDRSYFEQGGTSLNVVRLQALIQQEFGQQIPITDLLRFRRVGEQAKLLLDAGVEPDHDRHAEARSDDVAIIGIGLQVPGAGGVHEFWAQLRGGEETITFYDDDALRGLGVAESDLRDPHYVKAAGRLTGVNSFDDALFAIPPAEVDVTSPQLRLLYKTFWRACEDAGYDPTSLPGRVGVFVGGNDDFAWYGRSLQNPAVFGEAYQNFTLATNHFLGTRLSYQFDLTGPSLSALTGCSTSLLTVHLAVQSLRTGECDLAVAGGVTLELPNDGGYRYVDGMMLSPDGHCRPFDAKARGTVFSNGAALMLLKPLAAALADHDPIYAVIKGSAVGNDGRRKGSYTAPSEDGQYETIRAAYESAGIDPATVSYVEAHGTGTLLGDPVEVAALTRAFADAPAGHCLLGSVKGNVGHTDSAAGAVGLSKVALSLQRRYLPGTCNYESPNPHIDFAATPFTVLDQGRAWPGERRRAGINSFGVGGTNVHMIIEEAPSVLDSGSPRAGTDGNDRSRPQPYELLQFSAASPQALERTSARVLTHLVEHPDIATADVATTLRRGRAQLPHRKTLVVAADEARDTWPQRIAAAAATSTVAGARTALLYSGQGNQYCGMGRDLYHSSSADGECFRHWMDQLVALLPADDADVFREVIYGQADPRINRTEWSQFALFSTQYAMTKVLQSYQITPDVLVGHSIGELTAAAVAGVWSIEDAVRLVRHRGMLMQAQQPGVMIAVSAPAARVRDVIADLEGVWLSLENSAERSVLGLTGEALDAVLDRLELEGIWGSRLQTSHAFHTPLMAEAACAFADAVAEVESRDPELPVISNRSGCVARAGELTDPHYWGQHITDQVRFATCLSTLLSDGPLFGIELGPGQTLTSFAAQEPTRRPDQVFVNVLRHAAETTPDEQHLLGALGRLWGAGLPLDGAHDSGRRISLPGYVFDETPHVQDRGVGDLRPPAEPTVSIPFSIAPPPLGGAEASGAGTSGPGRSESGALGEVRAAFQHVLGHSVVADDDDFFSLGGDSLKATGLSAQLRQRLGVTVTVADVFATSTPAGLAQRFGGIGEIGGPPVASVRSMRKAAPAPDYPLSPAQQRMYLAAKLDPAGLVYNMASATRLDGSLDLDRVRLALRRLAARHEPLRTTFVERQGDIRQRVTPVEELPAEWPLEHLTADIADQAVAGLMADFVRPFDLQRGPLFRMAIVDGGAAGSLLLFDIHHIVADATSAEILSRDFSRLYREELPPLPLQYTDVVMHLAQLEGSDALTASEDELVAGLRDAPTDELLIPDHPRGSREPSAGRVELRLGVDRVEAIKRLGDRHAATPFMTMLAAWGQVLARTADRADLVVGVPVTGRTLAETAEMAGMFVNLMPIRLRPTADATFSNCLEQTRESVLSALTRQDVPFDRVVERLGVRRNAARHPLCDVSLDYHNIEHHELDIDGVTARQLELPPVAVGMDLVITCTESADGLRMQVDYPADVFLGTTIEHLVAQLDAVLASVCEDAGARLDQLPGPSAAEEIRARLIDEPFRSIHDVIAGQAARTPAATALIDATGDRYSYAELDEMANAQAARLRAAGLRTGETVALFAVRDVNLFVAQLAILKAGGAYLPLDPSQPAARHARILDDLRPRFGFAPAGLASAGAIPTVFDIATCTQARLGTLDATAALGDTAVDSESPVYVVYTSGSTGAPKGIVIPHRGVANLLRDHQERRLFAPGDVIISLADPTFDIFTFESLIPLACGASVHICPVADQKDAAAIATRITTFAVTHVQMPVSKMAALCGHPRFRDRLRDLRVIVCGGEHFAESLLGLLQAETDARVFNMYGPSETTVTATVKEFARGDDITVGTAIRGAAALIVDESGAIAPAGVTGELCIAGPGLALGYTNDPQRMAHAFTEIRELPGITVYRTGDSGLRRADGEIQVLGRIDHQVKVNGNRIELGELEQTAMRVAGVSYAVAAVEDDALVLYHCTRDGVDRATQIRAEVAAALPSYMQPARIRLLAELPVLPNDKVDRAALRLLTTHRGAGVLDAPTPASPPEQAAPGVTPQETLDHILAAWEFVLGQAVRAGDNFFDVGGSSYKLMLVNNRLAETLGVEVPLTRLFEHPTPQSLADVLNRPHADPHDQGDAADPETDPPITLDDLAALDDWPERRPGDERKIAVIGMAGEFPGSPDLSTYWANRFDGRVSISRHTPAELRDAGIPENLIDDPRYVNARGVVEADVFDADFFGYSAKEAETMDPQLRLLHQTAWHALEDAGYVPGEHSATIALFAGSGSNVAWVAGLLGRNSDPIGAYEVLTANEKDFLATKVAYKLNLTGPAMTVQSACSTSLVAVHEAVRCLRQGDADMALAGGVALNFPRREGYAWSEGMIFSRDGVCRPFSEDADGTVGGQGCGVVLLKPLNAALADGDHIYAVIAGSAVNNDGGQKMGFTAPSVGGHEQVIRAALADAGVAADAVGFVEAHGTGTSLGDPIEYAALARAYGQNRPCALGSVKANIGHLDAAAGIAGLLGAVGVLRRGQIPPMAGFTGLSSRIEQQGSLFVPSEVTVPTDELRLAAVSSLGIGGTNAHIVLERAPERPAAESESELGPCVLPVSARTDDSRRRMQEALEAFCRGGAPLRDVSYTLAQGRGQYPSRAAAVAAADGTFRWIEPSDASTALNVSDDVDLVLGSTVRDDSTPAGVALRDAVERELRGFHADVREQLRPALEGSRSAPVGVRRVAQFVLRAAVLRVTGSDALFARPGADRLLRIAAAAVRGELRSDQIVTRLRDGGAPTGPSTSPADAVSLVSGPVDASLVRELLVSLWVHGTDVDRSLFCATGRRVPLPGYAFERRRFTSDVRLDHLLGLSHPTPTPVAQPALPASAAVPAPASATATADQPTATADAIRATWSEVLGTAPTPDADFLASGGDSLTAVRFCALLADRAGAELTVADVFAHSRYRDLASLAESRRSPSEPAACLVPVLPQPVPQPAPADARAPQVVPASPAQQRLYAACALREDSTAYNLALAYRVVGPLDVDALRAVFARLVARHEQLRTSFHLEGGRLVQHIHARGDDVVSVLHLSAAQAAARRQARPRSFDLSSAPLLRVEVVRVSAEEHFLSLDLHHIVADQTSLAVLSDEITAELQGHPVAGAPISYTDYVADLQARTQSGAFDQDVAFFAELLDGEIPRLELPTDRTPSGAATHEGARHTFVSAARRRDVADLARACGATPYMVHLTALTRLLSLYSGQPEFVVGTAVSGRTMHGSERVVGMFANTLPLRLRTAAEHSVADAVATVRDDVLALLAHQEAPLDQVLAQLRPAAGGPDDAPFDVLVNYVTVGTDEPELDGLRLEPQPPGPLMSRYALSVSIAERADDFEVDIEYRTELFDAGTISRLARQLDLLLVELTVDPSRLLRDLRLESPAELARRRAELTAAGPEIDSSLLDRLRTTLTEHAHRTALSWHGREWTYAEVDRVTDSIAGGLQEAGVGVGDFVVCLVERDPWQVFCRLALLKCGAIEIPQDPQTPLPRLAHILADSGARVVLATDPGAHPWSAEVTAYRPDALAGSYTPPADLTATSPLILIYTSGTTGQPKGTLVSHGGVLSASVDNGYMDYRPDQRIMYLTGSTFDPSLLDLYATLLCGATLVLGDHTLNQDMAMLTRFLREERIDAGILITAVFHLLMAEDPAAVSGLTALYVGGEAMQPWAARRAFDVLGPGRLYNLYGPTEASVCSTWYRVDEAPEGDRMPIGYPARNRELFIVHPDGTDVPRGVPGELCVAGPGVALGYHHRPDLTSERFPAEIGAIRRRLYRTGDRVVLDERGRIVYLDRTDRQVKHAGHRIELSEIEFAVQACTGVGEAVVVHTKDGNDSRLTAFYTGASAPDEDDLRAALHAALPPHLVPQHLVRLPGLPLTPHGKVDHRLLASQAQPARTEHAGPAVTAAATDLTILAIFREVLGRPELGLDDDFFAAGAQSLQAIAVVRRLRETGLEVQISDLYRHPSAAALAVILSATAGNAGVWSEPSATRTLAAEQVRRLVTWAVADSVRVAEAFTDEQPDYRFEIGAAARLHRSSGATTGGYLHAVEHVTLSQLKDAVAAIVLRHEMLRARLVGDHFEVLPPEAFEGLAPLLAVLDLRGVEPQQLQQVTEEVAVALPEEAFGSGLLWRCVILQDTDDSVRLVWAFHHSIFDGFSAGILREEITCLVRGADLTTVQPYSRYAEAVAVEPDWGTELASYDYEGWLTANASLLDAPAAARPRGRRSLRLERHNPLELAIRTVHEELSRLSGQKSIAVGLVNDCRRWLGQDYTDCVGEFLDVVPVLLRDGAGTHGIAERLDRAREEGVHFLDGLSTTPDRSGLLGDLQQVYRNEQGRLQLTLVNFQGHIPAHEMPQTTADGPGLAHTHVNVWHDDEHLHLEWLADSVESLEAASIGARS